jgi:heavy metal sensor kinase
MIVLGSAGLWMIDRELWGNFDEMLRARAGAIESDLQHDVGHVGSEDAQEIDALGVNLDVVREWDRSGKLIYSRAGIARDLASGTVPPADQVGEGEGYSDERLADGRTVRLFSRAVSDHGRLLGYVQVGRNTGEIERIVGRLQFLGMVGLLLALVIAAAGGWFLAGRALGPIDRITRAAERIGADDLSRRLDLRLPDDELGRLAHAFDAMIGRLDGAFERQRRFTADASHELRTPLGVIRSQSEVALSRPRSTEYYERVLASIRDETGRLTRLAESLLILARADAGKALTLEEIDYENLVAEVSAGVAPSAREARVRLSVQLDDCPSVLGDETWLTQLLLNLLDNAIRHTPAGGELMVSLSTARDGALVQVADTGEGIAPEHLPHLFERFYRVDASRSRADGGAGLGLAICQWIARAHGGDLTIASTLGVGTTVSVWLPAASTGHPPALSTAAVADGTGVPSPAA